MIPPSPPHGAPHSSLVAIGSYCQACVHAGCIMPHCPPSALSVAHAVVPIPGVPCVSKVLAPKVLFARAPKSRIWPYGSAHLHRLVARIPLPPPMSPSDAWVQSYGPTCDPLSWGAAPSRVSLVGAACQPHCWPAHLLPGPQQPSYVWLVVCRIIVQGTSCCFPAGKAGQPQTWHPPCWLPTLVYS